VGEVRAVDDDQHVGLCRHHSICRHPDAFENGGQPRDHGGKAHDGDLLQGEERVQAFLCHGMPADAAEAQALGPQPHLQGTHQLGAELVARFLARHDPDR
jgi:hypothetical protein